ncbi:unnamed protein product [Paramecium pentaurelia]|uniref:Uncharacterized protein n=1 Tax=Paramecium pentaurelia TaxID=43138 RepID=A0A8S1X888_9CILI|nr:unnamed protein product [Paramecium pentaurelia]
MAQTNSNSTSFNIQIIPYIGTKLINQHFKQQKLYIYNFQKIDYTKSLLGLSLKCQQNKVIQCLHDHYRFIIEQSQQKSRLIAIQKIKVEKYGCRTYFINDNVLQILARSERINICQ